MSNLVDPAQPSQPLTATSSSPRLSSTLRRQSPRNPFEEEKRKKEEEEKRKADERANAVAREKKRLEDMELARENERRHREVCS